MREFDSILSAYRRTDLLLDPTEENAEARARMDQAYFVLLFAQFESLVNDAAERLIRAERANPSWEARRACTLFDEKSRRLTFLEKLKLLIDPASPDYQKIKEDFEQRNQIAHGKPRQLGVDMNLTIERLQAIAARLQEPR